MKKKILIAVPVVLVAFAVCFLVVISLQPSTFSVERSATIAAPPAAVFAEVNDLKAWDAWSPWRKLDPNPKTTMSDSSAGKGAKFTWDGNQEIGAGSLTILDSQPNSRVDVEQAFVRPFEGKARMTFTLGLEGNGTKVTWRMDGTNDFFGKAMCLFMNMDAMLGKDFEQGLANMKQAVENDGPPPSTAGP